ncbi:MAG: hypothetical protein LH645_02760 [Actinomycetia bacterium]|nr:hypothetical protein [Actinomycetes bacterium]
MRHDSEPSAAFVDGSSAGFARSLRLELVHEHLGTASSGHVLDDPVEWFDASGTRRRPWTTGTSAAASESGSRRTGGIVTVCGDRMSLAELASLVSMARTTWAAGSGWPKVVLRTGKCFSNGWSTLKDSSTEHGWRSEMSQSTAGSMTRLI